MEEPSRIKEEIKNHLCLQFKGRGPGGRGVGELKLLENLIKSRLGSSDAEFLVRELSEMEVKDAVWDCERSKSPGPDGFNLSFFKDCWDIVKADLMRVMSKFFVNRKLTKGCNSSFIVLIPKREGSCGLQHFCPVSLIGSLYKIMAKVLARRMKSVVGKVIGDTQSAFIKG